MTVSWKVPQMMFSTLDARRPPAPPSPVRGPMTWMQVASLLGHPPTPTPTPFPANITKLFHTPARAHSTKVQFQLASSLCTSVIYALYIRNPWQPSAALSVGPLAQWHLLTIVETNQMSSHASVS